MPDTYERLLASIDELERAIEVGKRRMFWAGVFCGIGGTYLGYGIAGLLT